MREVRPEVFREKMEELEYVKEVPEAGMRE